MIDKNGMSYLDQTAYNEGLHIEQEKGLLSHWNFLDINMLLNY